MGNCDVRILNAISGRCTFVENAEMKCKMLHLSFVEVGRSETQVSGVKRGSLVIVSHIGPSTPVLSKALPKSLKHHSNQIKRFVK
jgi:hypothetical protein